MLGFRKNFSRQSHTIYLHKYQIIMPITRCSFDVSNYGTSGNEQTGKSDMENIANICILTYGTCKILGSVYSFCVNLYDKSYFPVLPIQDVINKDSGPTIRFKLATGTKHSISYLLVLFFQCVVRKATAQVGKKELNMIHQEQNRWE